MKKNKFLVVGAFILGLVLGVGLMSTETVWLPEKYQAAGEVRKNLDETGPLIKLGEFTVNLNGGGVLKTEITLEGIDSSSLKIIQEKQTFLTDQAITVLSSQKLASVSQLEGKGKIKRELLAELNKICNNEIKEVLFTSFIYSM
ncbi:MAG: flagellar basal body-associated FliL family protein [Bacillota bacterium]|jgi:flagellar FliL protein